MGCARSAVIPLPHQWTTAEVKTQPKGSCDLYHAVSVEYRDAFRRILVSDVWSLVAACVFLFALCCVFVTWPKSATSGALAASASSSHPTYSPSIIPICTPNIRAVFAVALLCKVTAFLPFIVFVGSLAQESSVELRFYDVNEATRNYAQYAVHVVHVWRSCVQ